MAGLIVGVPIVETRGFGNLVAASTTIGGEEFGMGSGFQAEDACVSFDGARYGARADFGSG